MTTTTEAGELPAIPLNASSPGTTAQQGTTTQTNAQVPSEQAAVDVQKISVTWDSETGRIGINFYLKLNWRTNSCTWFDWYYGTIDRNEPNRELTVFGSNGMMQYDTSVPDVSASQRRITYYINPLLPDEDFCMTMVENRNRCGIRYSDGALAPGGVLRYSLRRYITDLKQYDLDPQTAARVDALERQINETGLSGSARVTKDRISNMLDECLLESYIFDGLGYTVPFFNDPDRNLCVDARDLTLLKRKLLDQDGSDSDHILTLSGNVAKEDLRSLAGYRFLCSAIDIDRIVCLPGTVLPPDCSSLFVGLGAVSIDLSNADASNVTNMKEMFSGCKSLKTLDLSGFNTANVTNMRSMFYCCRSLESLDLHSFDTANVTSMYSMFNGCRGLKTLDLRGFDTPNLTSVQCMFKNCSSLTDLNLRSFDFSDVTQMGELFCGCSALESLVDPATYPLDRSSTDLFEGCPLLNAG